MERWIAQSKVWHGTVQRLDRNSPLRSLRMSPHVGLSFESGQTIAERRDGPCRGNTPSFSPEHRRKEVAQAVREELVCLGELHIAIRPDEAGCTEARNASVNARHICMELIRHCAKGRWNTLAPAEPEENNDVVAFDHG